MRWDALFTDLDARFDELADEALMAELADRTRVALGAVALTARLAGAQGDRMRMTTVAGTTVTGVLERVGPDWALLAEAPGREVLLNLRQVTLLDGLGMATSMPLRGVALRLDLRHMLRGVARDRSPVALVVPGAGAANTVDSGGTHTELTGTVDRVGADFLELAVHAPWEPRRAGSVRRVVAVPLAALVLVRAMPLG